MKTDDNIFLEKLAIRTFPAKQAVIREAECIGCTKCIQACPVDAIMGAPKSMHTVLALECTGCELCVAPCPVDCIDIIESTDPLKSADYHLTKFHAKKKRISSTIQNEALIRDRKSYIQAAVLRAKEKKWQK